jgi:hypothetical protein
MIQKRKTPPNFIDLTGQTFGKLTVIDRAKNKGRYTMWNCKCSCGGTTTAQTTLLRNAVVRSCGCLIKETNTKHNMHNSRAYNIWKHMKNRCQSLSNPRYNDYGGRGVTLCKKWLTFEGFWEDMRHGYKDDLTIDRIDVNGNYTKENCKWSTAKEQQNNTRANHLLTHKGVTLNVTQWAELLKINKHTLSKRIYRGWSVERALNEVV